MSERCVHPDWEIRGQEYELWSDGYDNWWLSGGHKPGWALTDTDFDPPLTEKELQAIFNYLHDMHVED